MRGKSIDPPPDVAAGEMDATASEIDPRIDDAARRGLAGTTRGNVYEATRDPDDISRAPDIRDELDPPEWREDFPIDWSKDEFVARRVVSR
jgi:hypothetical protein